ncbi:MAG TPA: hypothetical protein VFO16_02290, partial [Pseudonocardiaceae bacterium]|nr:hypothetical protein [Pseudonocardiaceae bacterium]
AHVLVAARFIRELPSLTVKTRVRESCHSHHQLNTAALPVVADPLPVDLPLPSELSVTDVPAPVPRRR